ncbi:MAG: asparagine synthase C-terminal domain-containing protein [Clostridia bacterium]|nr:asparagine synthase C-terminal domain-containing protein [Clostridia bacterium]
MDSALLLAASGVKRAASIRFRESACSEWEAASETAACLGRTLQGITLSPTEYLDAIPRYVRNAELPTSDSCVTAFLLDCEYTGGKGGPWLSGEGADEFFAGYNNYRLAPELAWDDGPTHYGLYGIMAREDARRLLGQERACPAEALVRDLYAQTARDEHLSRLLLIDIRLWLEGDILLSVNRSARANGVALVLPYADRRMFELSAAIPSDLKWRDGCGKYILRRTAERRLPHEIAFRKKIGFMNPLRQWFGEAAFRPRIEEVLFGEVSSRFFDRAILRRYWEGFLSGEVPNWASSTPYTCLSSGMNAAMKSIDQTE